MHLLEGAFSCDSMLSIPKHYSRSITPVQSEILRIQHVIQDNMTNLCCCCCCRYYLTDTLDKKN